MKKSVCYFIAILLLFCSCNKQEQIIIGKSLRVSVEATMPELAEDASTKASLDYVLKLSWEAENTLSVYNMSNGMSECGSLVAQSAGTTTTFTGTISGVTSSDKLLLVYNKGLNMDAGEGTLSFDFSAQSITTNANSVPFTTIATVQLSDEEINSGTISIKPTFQLPFVFLQVSMGGLPASTNIKEFNVFGLKYCLTLSYSATNGLVKTVGPDALTDDDRIKYLENNIVITPSSTMKTIANGTRSVYFTIPEQTNDASLARDFIVTLGSSEEDSVQYKDVIISGGMTAGKHYRTTLSNFQQYDKRVVSYSVSATHPAAMTNAPETESNTTWKAGETMTLINLTTKEVFGGSLVAESAGKTVTFSSNNLSCFHGLNAGDELLLVSPAIYTSETASDFNEGGITIEGLIGSTFADAKPIVSGTTIITKYSDSHSIEFDYMTSTVGLTVNGIAEYITAQQTLNSPRMRAMRAASNEGFNNENGEWDETESFNIDIEKVVLANLPLYVLAYDASTGYKVTTVQNEYSELTLTETFHLAGTNPSLKVYYSVPATGQIQPAAYLYSSSTKFYSGDATAAVTATKGSYAEQNATIDDTGEDTAGANPGEGGIG